MPGGRARIPARSGADRVVAGVCAGLADAVGIDPVLVRVATLVLAVTGPGIPLYVVAWLVMPSPGADHPAGRPADRFAGRPAGSTVEVHRAVGLGLVVLGGILTLRALGLTPPDAIVWPVVAVGAGVGVVVWQFEPRLESGRRDAVRIAAGIVVVGAGIAALIGGNVSWDVVRDGLLATVLVVGGLALIIGPWIAVVLRDRAEERRRRLHADARADMAAHLHDSVLQTLALMQRTDDPRAIASLARQQERELRRWLYADSDDPSATTLKSRVEAMAANVEDRHDVAVPVVVVGDAALDTTIEALIAAAGEAATNAAKWSGCSQVSVFVEVEDDGVRAFVRDVGAGFDPAEVAPDRLGIRESIVGRMERVGGTATITTAPGDGTEVELFAPVAAHARRDTV